MGSIFQTPLPPQGPPVRNRNLMPNIPDIPNPRPARRRRPPNTSILTAGLDVEFPPTPPLRLLASDEEEQPTPPPEEPEKPEPKPEPPKEPEEPEKPPPVDCEAISRDIDELNAQILAIRKEENAVRKEIGKLENEISQLRGEQSRDSVFSIDRPPNGADGRRPISGLGVAVRIGGRLLPIISGIMVAQGAIDTISRSQALALATQKLAALKEKLKEILRREKEKLIILRDLGQNFDKYCRGGSGPSNPDP